MAIEKTMSPAERARLLQKSITVASWWLMGQGALYTVMGRGITSMLHLRFNAQLIPYMDQAGLTTLGLGLFVNRAVRSASSQYLAVDTLVLYFIGHGILTMSYRIHGYTCTWLEWVGMGVEIGLAIALILFRTRGSEMAADGSLVARDVKDVLRQAKELTESLKEKRPSQAPAPVTVASEAPAPAPAAAPAAAPEAPKPKPISEAMPHMD